MNQIPSQDKYSIGMTYIFVEIFFYQGINLNIHSYFFLFFFHSYIDEYISIRIWDRAHHCKKMITRYHQNCWSSMFCRICWTSRVVWCGVLVSGNWRGMLGVVVYMCMNGIRYIESISSILLGRLFHGPRTKKPPIKYIESISSFFWNDFIVNCLLVLESY